MIQISKLTSSALSLLCFTQVTSGPGHAENIAGFQHESERESEESAGGNVVAMAHSPRQTSPRPPLTAELPWTSGKLNSAGL